MSWIVEAEAKHRMRHRPFTYAGAEENHRFEITKAILQRRSFGSWRVLFFRCIEKSQGEQCGQTFILEGRGKNPEKALDVIFDDAVSLSDSAIASRQLFRDLLYSHADALYKDKKQKS